VWTNPINPHFFPTKPRCAKNNKEINTTMNTEIERIKSAVTQIAGHLAYVLRHMSEPAEASHSDKAHMEDIASQLDKISEDLQS